MCCKNKVHAHCLPVFAVCRLGHPAGPFLAIQDKSWLQSCSSEMEPSWTQIRLPSFLQVDVEGKWRYLFAHRLRHWVIWHSWCPWWHLAELSPPVHAQHLSHGTPGNTKPVELELQIQALCPSQVPWLIPCLEPACWALVPPQSPWFVPSWALNPTPAGAELPFAAELRMGNSTN